MSVLRVLRGGAAFGAVTVTVALSLLTTSAYASDTFGLKNDSKTASLLGTSLWGEGNTIDASCRTGPFPGPTETAFTFSPGDSGAITLSQDPFSSCLSAINPLVANDIDGPGISGDWYWYPVDPPVGDAYLNCSVLQERGNNLLEASVDGRTCTFADAGNATAGKFSSSAAPLRNMKAVAYVQHFPGLKQGHPVHRRSQRHRGGYTVVLRSETGRMLGRKKVRLSTGQPKKVRVGVGRNIRRKVRKHGSARVEAVIKRTDGTRGVGDHATISVVRDSPEVPF